MKAKLTTGIQGEFTLTVNGVQAEVGIGGDAVLVLRQMVVVVQKENLV